MLRARHAPPSLADYELLRRESAEMAWIATEGNVFNHATDRVEDVSALAAKLRRLGQPMKDTIEVSATGRVKQTAMKADIIERTFVTEDGDLVHRRVPGSFFEFIERAEAQDPETGRSRLDLSSTQGTLRAFSR